MKKVIIGNLESCDLPELTIQNMPIRIDTGAKTSSLHVDNIKKIMVNRKPMVEFDIHPDIHTVDTIVKCRAALHDIRKIKSSNGKSEQRYVIKTPIVLGESHWEIEITLTDRSDMSYLMLLGREAMEDRFLVDPAQVFVASNFV